MIQHNVELIVDGGQDLHALGRGRVDVRSSNAHLTRRPRLHMDDKVAAPEPGGAKNGARRGPGRPRLEQPSPEYVARREEIVAKAAELFREKGFDALTLDDVADALGFRRASLYYYVKSKSHLLSLIFEGALESTLRELAEETRIADPVERLRVLIRKRIRKIADKGDMFTLFFDHRSRLDSRYDDVIRTQERRYFRMYQNAVAAAVKAGAIDNVDTRYATQAIFGRTNWTYKWFRPGRDDADDFADVCIRFILGDVKAQKP